MGQLPEVNPESSFARAGPIERRVNGVISYFILILVTIWNPYIADASIYRVLKRQFGEEDNDGIQE